MKYLFSETGKRVLESLAYTNTLFAFDFDGTLAPIVKIPSAAKPHEKTEQMLRLLSRHTPIAIVSGRSLADLKKRIRCKTDHLIGNHGLEGLNFKKNPADGAKRVSAKWLNQLARHKQSFESVGGIQIENKTYSLALHYRHSRNKRKARELLLQAIQKLSPPPRIILGKCVFNLVPAGAPHKGIALLELMSRLKTKCAFYIGDDDTDEDVFSLDNGTSNQSRIISVRVGKKKSSHAQFYIRRQSEILQLLKSVLSHFERAKKHERK